MAGKTKISQFLKTKGSNQGEAAQVIGVSESVFSIKAKGFTDEEKGKLAAHYGMTDDEMSEVFK